MCAYNLLMKKISTAYATCAFDVARRFTTANSDFDHFEDPQPKEHMRWAYSLAAKKNQWTSMAQRIANWSYSVGVYRGNKPDRMITFWRDPADNHGFKFSVHRHKRQAVFRTNNLKHALGNFKSVDPELYVVCSAPKP